MSEASREATPEEWAEQLWHKMSVQSFTTNRIEELTTALRAAIERGRRRERDRCVGIVNATLNVKESDRRRITARIIHSTLGES